MRSNENSNSQRKMSSFYEVFHKIEDELNSLYERSMICFSNDSKTPELKLQKISEESFSQQKKIKKALM